MIDRKKEQTDRQADREGGKKRERENEREEGWTGKRGKKGWISERCVDRLKLCW